MECHPDHIYKVRRGERKAEDWFRNKLSEAHERVVVRGEDLKSVNEVAQLRAEVASLKRTQELMMSEFRELKGLLSKEVAKSKEPAS